MDKKADSNRKKEKLGSVLLSHKAAPAVPSALKHLTSVFEMGTGVPASLSPPSYILILLNKNLLIAKNFSLLTISLSVWLVQVC